MRIRLFHITSDDRYLSITIWRNIWVAVGRFEPWDLFFLDSSIYVCHNPFPLTILLFMKSVGPPPLILCRGHFALLIFAINTNILHTQTWCIYKLTLFCDSIRFMSILQLFASYHNLSGLEVVNTTPRASNWGARQLAMTIPYQECVSVWIEEAGIHFPQQIHQIGINFHHPSIDIVEGDGKNRSHG